MDRAPPRVTVPGLSVTGSAPEPPSGASPDRSSCRMSQGSWTVPQMASRLGAPAQTDGSSQLIVVPLMHPCFYSGQFVRHSFEGVV